MSPSSHAVRRVSAGAGMRRTMHNMSRDEWLEFALHGTRTGKLAFTSASGQPLVTPIWFLIDTSGQTDQLVFTTHNSSVKSKALKREPRFAVCVDDQQPPYSYVQFQATATLSEDLGE